MMHLESFHPSPTARATSPGFAVPVLGNSDLACVWAGLKGFSVRHYPRHIGDYRSATAHLTDAEDLAYTRLLDSYYDTEMPIPLDLAQVSRRLRVDPAVLTSVLSDFFTEQADGWHQARCDEEIAKYHDFSNSGKRGAEKRWGKDRHPIGTLQSAISPPNAPLIATVNQEPRTIESTPLSGKPDVPHSNGKKKLSESCLEILNFLNEKTERNYQPVKANINLIAARLREGATVDQCRQVIAKKCREWRDDPNQEIYLRPKTLFNATNFANYQGELVP